MDLPAALRTATRGIVRRPRAAVFVVAAVAIGVGANCAAFSVLRSIYFANPAGIDDPARVVRLQFTRREPPFEATTSALTAYPVFRSLSRHLVALSATGAYATRRLPVGRGPDARQLTVQAVSPSYFLLLGATPHLGVFFVVDEEFEDARTAVISYRYWRSVLGGDTAAIGRSLSLGANRYVIAGIASEGFRGADWSDVDLWLPLGAAAGAFGYSLACHDCSWLQVIGRLGPAARREQAEAQATGILRGESADPLDSLTTVNAVRLQSSGTAPSKEQQVSIRLAGAALLLYLMACSIVGSLSLMTVNTRRREIAVRWALGARWTHVAQQLLQEDSIVGALGALAAFTVGWWCNSLANTQLLRRHGVDGGPDLYSAILAVVMTLLAVLIGRTLPTMLATRRRFHSTGDGLTEASGRPSFAQASMVALQVAITMILLVGAGLFLKSLGHVSALSLGIEPTRLVYISIDYRQAGLSNVEVNRLFATMQENVDRLPIVERSALSIGSPFTTSLATAFTVPGAPDSAYHSSEGGPYMNAVSTDYFAALGARIQRGRGIDSGDQVGSQRIALVNEAMARSFWPFDDPLGKCMKIGTRRDTPCAEIVGVVENVKRIQIIEPPAMQYYVPLAQVDSGFFLPVTALLVRTTGRAEEAVDQLRSTAQSSSPDMPFVTAKTMTDLYGWQLRSWQLGSVVLTCFAFLGLVLASVGLYGSLSYFVSQRSKEIGVRMALGAARQSVLLLILRRGLSVSVVGAFLGAAGTRLLAPLARSSLFGVPATDPVTVLQALALLLLVACLASYGPARRAASIDPAVVLRNDEM